MYRSGTITLEVILITPEYEADPQETIDDMLEELENSLEGDFQMFLCPRNGLTFKGQGNRPLYPSSLVKQIIGGELENDKVYSLEIIRQSKVSFNFQQSQPHIDHDKDPLKSINHILKQVISCKEVTQSQIDEKEEIPVEVNETLISLINLIQDLKQSDYIDSLNQQIRLLNEKQDELNLKHQSDLDEFTKRTNQLHSQQIQIFENQIALRTKQSQHLKDEIQKLKQSITALEATVILVKEQNIQLRQNISSILQSPFLQSEIYLKGIISSTLRADTENQFDYLRQMIEKNQNKKIKNLQKLYSYDPKYKTNFHCYVDGHKDFLLLAKTHKGNLIGGYSQAALETDWAHEKSVLFSLTDKKVINILETKKSKGIQYDPYFIIFGKEEICIRNGQNILHCELGARGNNCYQNLSNYSYKQFINEEGKDTKLDKYEILQVVFKK